MYRIYFNIFSFLLIWDKILGPILVDRYQNLSEYVVERSTKKIFFVKCCLASRKISWTLCSVSTDLFEAVSQYTHRCLV